MKKIKGFKATILNKKRIVVAFCIFSVVLVALCVRTGYLQIVRGNELETMAVEQQMKDEILQPKRGGIYDRNGNELAVNIESYSVWVRPGEMKTGKDEAEKQKNYEDTIAKLAELLGNDKEELQKTIEDSKRTLLKVSKSVDRDKADEIREAGLTGVSLNQEVKRYYPMGDFLSHTLGSVTDDNSGLSGIELAYDRYLAGVEGRWVKNTDISGNSLVDGTEKYYEPQDGSNVVLTIDQVIQNYTEKSVKAAYEKYKAKRVSCIVMETETGEIMSMASAPSFDPNNSRVPTDEKEKEEFSKLSADEQMDYLNIMWRNPLISNVYEPGSTAKLITTAAALEEGITKKDESFKCEGYYTVNGIQVKCWSYEKPHGTENLYESVGNSCNPVFMQLAMRLGKEKYYDYLDLFGLSEPTGIDFPGEASPILANEETASQLDLAIMGFGQTNAVTPIQMITAASALGNDGKLMEPHLVKELTDSDGNTVETIEPKVVRQAVSKDTADEMRVIMQSVVDNATGSKAQIAGYSVGGKTGTSQVADTEHGGYTSDVIASFIGMAPMEDPKYTILYIIDSPAGGDQGGEIAAPESRDLLEKILKYADIKPNYTEEEQKEIEEETTVSVPNVTGKKLSEAKKLLSENGLKYIISPEMEEETEFVIKEQYPAAGEKSTKNGIVYLYRE